jgi:hypothetical protein
MFLSELRALPTLSQTGEGVRCRADFSVDAPRHESTVRLRRRSGATTRHLHDPGQLGTAKTNGSDNLLLQMDIEGAEYDVLLTRPKNCLPGSGSWSEFHNLHGLFDPRASNPSIGHFSLLAVFEVVHIHPNNCCDPVVLLHRDPAGDGVYVSQADRVLRKGHASTFPHDLDRANVSERPDYPLPACWQGLQDPLRIERATHV